MAAMDARKTAGETNSLDTPGKTLSFLPASREDEGSFPKQLYSARGILLDMEGERR